MCVCVALPLFPRLPIFTFRFDLQRYKRGRPGNNANMTSCATKCISSCVGDAIVPNLTMSVCVLVLNTPASTLTHDLQPYTISLSLWRYCSKPNNYCVCVFSKNSVFRNMLTYENTVFVSMGTTTVSNLFTNMCV